MPDRIVVSAPGKIILHGEHAVVYGKRAIACAINGSVEVELEIVEDGTVVTIALPEMNICNGKMEMDVLTLKELYKKCNQIGTIVKCISEWHQNIKDFVLSNFHFSMDNDNQQRKLLTVAIAAIIFGYFRIIIANRKLSFPSLLFKISSNNLPVGAGLGSSAAFNVGIATALLLCGKRNVVKNSEYLLDKETLETINELAYSMEKVVHGNPSGIDNSVSTFGGAVAYEGGNMTQFPKFPGMQLLIVDSKVTRNTKKLVSDVKSRVEKFPEVMNPILDSIHGVTVAAEKLFYELSDCCNGKDCDGYYERFKELIQINQHLLNAIGVGHPKLDEIHKVAEEHNFACKLTGAGGGGCAVILLDKNSKEQSIDALKEKLSELGFKSWHAVLGCSGVRVIECTCGNGGIL